MANRLHLLSLFFFLCGLGPIIAQPCDCVSTGNCPVPIQDNGTYVGELDVTVNGPNDLGTNPLTSVCFTITHTWVGDLSVSLISPNNTAYLLMADLDNNFGGCNAPGDNVDICIVPGTANPLTNNGDYPNTAGGPCTQGLCMIVGDWTVACGGVTDPINNIPQAPNCNLTDFNQPGAPANGTWQLVVNDVCNQDTGTLDNFALTFANGTESCIVCEADGGQVDTTILRTCVGNPSLIFNLPPGYGADPPPDVDDYAYTYVLSQGGIILSHDEDIDLTGQPAGTYQLHGLSYLISDTSDLNYMIGLDTALLDTQLMSTTAPFCADLSENFKTIIIEEAPAPVSLTETVCAGTCANVDGLVICSDTSYTLTSWLGCDSLIQVTLTEVTTSAVIAPASPPTLTCANPTATLDGSASTPGTVSYAWSGPGTFSAATAAITVDVPGTYTLTVSENSVTPACTSTASITVMDGLQSPDLSVSGAPTICNGENFDLNALTISDLNSTGAPITFHDGTPATPANELSGTVVSPTATTTYYVLATSGNCSDEEAVTVTVTDLPTANFSTDGPTCILGPTTVTYGGNASGTANYTWDFGGGAASPGTGPGPHAVTWPNSGTYTITLTVEENGCTSAMISENVTVEAELAAPVISCNTTTSTVEFSWSAMPNGTTVNVLTSHAGTLGAGDTTYLVTGLSPNEEVIIEVTAIGTGACGNSVAQQSCTAQNCPTVMVDIDPVADICLSANSAAFDLSTVITGDNGSGTLTFSGDGITDAALGTFDPQAANIGANSVVATYTEGNCPFTGAININVFQTPEASFMVTPNICESGNATVTFDGTAPAGSTFVWDFDGGMAMPGTGAGPHTVTWPTAGVYDVSLTVNSPDGCSDSAAAQSVTVDAPLAPPGITCGNATSTSVVFSWTADPAVSNYNVTSPSGHVLTQIGPTSWEATGLTSSENVEIEVEAVSANACANVTAQQICASQNCPNVTFTFDPVAPICSDPSTQPFIIPASITGTGPGGSVVWSGPGITNTQTGEFDPLQANEGDNLITVTYTEGTCVFTENTTIEVHPSPQGSISVITPICEGVPTLLTFTGDPTGIIFDWNFGGGFPVNIGGGVEGPYEVTWTSTGLYTVSVYLYTQDCFVLLEEEVEVQGAVQPVIPNCSSTTSTVDFTWDVSPNATEHTVEVLSGQAFADSTLASISFANLQPEEEVSIALILGNNTNCPPDTMFASCSSLPCPELDLVVPNCTSTTNSVEFAWDVSANATSYTVEVLSGHTFTDSTMTSIAFDNLPPEEEVSIALILGSEPNCPSDTMFATCSSLPCPDIDLSIQPVGDICLGTASAVPLMVNVVGSDGSGTGVWSGNGVDATNGTFDPMAASFGEHMVAYTFMEQGCTYQDSIAINVYEVPTASFSADAVICMLNAATVAFDGVAGANAIYTWDFDGGVATPGAGTGPHTVMWGTPGAKTISLSIEENGCASQIFTQNIQVDEALTAPMLNCQSTTDSVTFTWADVPNATNYVVEVLTGPMGVQNGNAYAFSNLDPGQEVAIRVTVEGNTSCPFPAVEQTCNAMDCPVFDIQILPVGPYCLDGNAAPTQLSASVVGGSGNGTFAWSGAGVTDANGAFDPNLLPMGEHTVAVVYTEVNCTSSSEMSISMVAPPVADAGADYMLSCWDENEEYRLGGNATSEGADIAYQWTMAGGTFPDNTNIPTPTVGEPGTYTLVVTNTQLGCSATDEVSVFASEDLPIPQLDVLQPDCQGGTDPMVSIPSVSGGMEPFLFSLDGAPYVAADTFPFLEIGGHTLDVIDANGCEYADSFTIDAPVEVAVDLTANLVGRPLTAQGETAQLLALPSLPATELDSIHWSPDSLLSCHICLDPLASPNMETLFWVTIYHNGCEATDSVRIYVERENPVYVPNAFSPNGDNINDFFTLYPGPTVVNVKNFMVFDRWGEMVYEHQNFDPAQPATGWDGTLDGKPMNPAVFAWFAEVELADGTVEFMEGDVTLVR